MGLRQFQTRFRVFVFLGIWPLLVFGCDWGGNSEADRNLYGRWVTSEPRYQNCQFEISEDLVVFRNNPDHVLVGHVKKVRKSITDKTRHYQIVYTAGDGMVYTLKIHFSEDSGGPVLRFENRNQARWVKAPPQ